MNRKENTMSAQSKTSTVFLEPEVKIDFSISLRNASGDKKKKLDEPATPKLVIDSSGSPPTGGGNGGSPSPPPPSKPPG